MSIQHQRVLPSLRCGRSAVERRHRPLRVVLRRTIRGAERRLYDPSETSASPWLHCAIHQSLGPALQVALSGQELPFAMGFRLTWERTFVEMPAR